MSSIPKVADGGVCPPRPAHTACEPATAVPLAYYRPLTVLMVEDEEFLRVPVAKILRRQGFVVLESADGRAAMDLFLERAGEIDVVLLDMTLPGVSGADVMALMTIIRSDIKVILTSALDLQTVMQALHGQSPAGYIRKPYSSVELAALLRATCSGKARAETA